MRVTRSEHPDRLTHFGHIEKAGRGRPRCGVECPGVALHCSRERAHAGPHVAHGRLGRVDAAWDGTPARHAPTKSPGDRGYRGPPVRNPGSPNDASMLARVLRSAIDRFFASFPETVMLIFFVAFVFFAIVWALQVLPG